jgi:hypothetical protein
MWSSILILCTRGLHPIPHMHLFEYLILIQLCLFSMRQQESILLSCSINYKYPNWIVINTFFKRIDSSYICYYITLYLYFAAQHRAALMTLPVLIDNPAPRGAGGCQAAIGRRGRRWQGGRGEGEAIATRWIVGGELVGPQPRQFQGAAFIWS